ncbi:uncharacterized protein EI97DRAFT_436666 [Westerdykella ornata]|uniref:CENP-V/GFA domain-containing protein n=1 Tax=Westerdykella ornata TaxID=318751 RepID=A0A6A6J8H9_WESOR|nr:uncharacterized protein EI97DRAFT_436666 [Westerdykella ornata]KAF2272732.1 hypothetical protein EI97DRAFT_436666 [Westerdykella ornata]
MAESRKPFPFVHGGCTCTTIRYRLLSAPLFVYACHCGECQKSSGSVFKACCIMEFDHVRLLSPTRPLMRKFEAVRHTRIYATCPKCYDVLWHVGSYEPSTINVRVGTLDLPGLMEPDLHIYTESKVDWLVLKEGTRTVKGDMNRAKEWPKSSLIRLLKCKKRYEERIKRESEARKLEEEAEANSHVDEGEGEAEEKTPRNGSPEPSFNEEEEAYIDVDDDEFERRYEEMEKVLQERLEKLSLKLSNQEETNSEGTQA